MVWTFNPHEDFVPYYDKLRGRWAVSIQYLDVWYFRTKELAEGAIPILKAYREKVLRWVEEQNRKYYKAVAHREGLLRKELSSAKKKEVKEKEKLCKHLSQGQKAKLEMLLDSGYTDEEIMEIIPISKRAVALKRWHRYKGEKNGCTEGTITRDA